MIVLLVITVFLALVYKTLTIAYLCRLKKTDYETWKSLGSEGPRGLIAEFKSSQKVDGHFSQGYNSISEDSTLKALRRSSNIIGLGALLCFFSFLALTIYILAIPLIHK